MALSPDALAMLDCIVTNPEDDVAFRSGYTAGSDPASELAIATGPTSRIGTYAVIAARSVIEGSWVSQQGFEVKDGQIYIANPAFMLGAAAAAASRLKSRQKFEAELAAI